MATFKKLDFIVCELQFEAPLNGYHFLCICTFLASYPIQFTFTNCHNADFLSDLVQRGIEAGFMIHFEEKTNRILRLRTLKREPRQLSTLAIQLIPLEDLKYVFIFYIFGVVFSLFIALAEIYYFKMREQIYALFYIF